MSKDKKNADKQVKTKEIANAKSELKTMSVVAIQSGQYHSMLKSKGQAFIIDKDDYPSVAHWVELE